MAARVIVGNGKVRSSSITDLNIRKTDKGQNLFIGVVGEKNARQI